jgi:hypothetical protein
MKVKSVLCPAALIGAVVIAQLYASAAIPDAVTADGKHYTIEFENQYVRVLRIHYGFPHERGNMHNHPRSVTVFLTDGKLKMTMFKAGDEVLISGLEHHSNIVPWQMLCDEKQARLRVVHIDDRGVIPLDQFEKR